MSVYQLSFLLYKGLLLAPDSTSFLHPADSRGLWKLFLLRGGFVLFLISRSWWGGLSSDWMMIVIYVSQLLHQCRNVPSYIFLQRPY